MMFLPGQLGQAAVQALLVQFGVSATSGHNEGLLAAKLSEWGGRKD